jgi:quinoprotein glucose dehydrogenase
MHRLAAFLLFLAVLAGVAVCAPHTTPEYRPHISPASDAPARAMKGIRVPPELRLSLFAAEPLLANPVAFCIDHKNRFYVAETFRLHAGVTDIRGHMDWLDDDLACRTVEDRAAMYRRRLGKKVSDYAVEHDRVRLIEDTTGKGRADRATVFADGFNHIEDGIGAGLLARGSDVYYTCIPDLWLLRDSKGEGKADVRRSLHHGFGVHTGFIGHDLHGLTLGPDGKLYFSIGDRGLNVKTPTGTLAVPDAGSVLRCNLDGSELEVFATGLRNPQELAFDDFGNLFTCDNNSDGGDQARWVHIVEGGDSGWRIGYQFGSAMGPRGPFMAEDLWKPRWQGQAAYFLPPLANLGNGPSGLAYYPGLGLPERYRGHFFLCDFRGGSGGSGIHSFAVEPEGASFKLVDRHDFVWSVLATDVDFGTDCSIYFTDWVEGWDKPGKGRIYKVTDPKRASDPAVKEVGKLLAEGMSQRPAAELVRLLENRDRRVRQEAQLALAGRGKEALEPLADAAEHGKSVAARVHALWGLGQIARTAPEAMQKVLALTSDRQPEVRAQAARVLGDQRVAAAFDRLLALLEEGEPRVQFFAAQSLGRLGHKEAVGPVLELLRTNADRDLTLRHAAVMALAGTKDVAGLAGLTKDAASSVRLGAILALRRLGSAEVARFLGDTEPALVLETARAIYDTPIEAALPQLAALLTRPGLDNKLGFRVLNAHFRLGKAENAAAVAAFAARSDASEVLRIEALHELASWSKPAGRDRVMGLWRPLPERSPQLAQSAVRAHLGGLFSGPNKVRQEATKLAASLGIKEVGPVLFVMAGDGKRPASVRIEALRALAALKDQRLDRAVQQALRAAEPLVRNEGRRLLAQSQPEQAMKLLEQALQDGKVSEQQGAFAILGDMKSPAATALLGTWLDHLQAGKVPAEARLDLIEAAARKPDAAIRQRLARQESALPRDDPLARYRDTLVGGSAEVGRHIFFEKAAVSCLRCHKVQGVGGEVGPDLTGIGTRQKRDYLLESIVLPSRQIARGFETVVLSLHNGKTCAGVLKQETDKTVQLMTPEGKLLVVPKDEIDERQTGKSAMPEDLTQHLSRREIRDLVEFLAGLREPAAGRPGG